MSETRVRKVDAPRAFWVGLGMDSSVPERTRVECETCLWSFVGPLEDAKRHFTDHKHSPYFDIVARLNGVRSKGFAVNSDDYVRDVSWLINSEYFNDDAIWEATDER